MAEVLASAYIQLMPSLKGAQAQIQREIQGSISGPVAAESKAAANVLAKNLGAAHTQVSQSFAASMRTAIQAYGGGAAVLSGLGQQASAATQRLSGLVQGSSALSSSTGALKAGLLGVSGLLGGPWALAVGGGALLLNHFAEQQKEAADRAKEMLDLLNQQTGALTQANAGKAASGILGALNDADQARLAKLGISVTDAVAAVVRGGKAYDDYIAKLQAVAKEESKGNLQTSGRGRAYSNTAASVRALIGAMGEQHEAITTATGDWSTNMRAQQIAGTVSVLTGLQVASTAAAVRGLSEAQVGAQGTLAAYSRGMSTVAASTSDVIARIRAVPSNVTISAKAVGLDRIKAQADAATAALLAMVHALQAGNTVADGERHGADVGAPNKTTQNVSKILAAYDAEYRRALAALNRHNAAVTTGGGASSRGARSSAASAISSARAALREQITASSFLSDLVGGSGSQIAQTLATLSKGAKAALQGSSETAITKLLKTDTVALTKLAGKRDVIAKRLTNAQQSLANLTSAKAQTTSALTQSAMGDLVGARSSSGVIRVLTKQLEKVKGFRSNLTILAKRGLPKAFLTQLVNAGLDGAMTAAALARSSDSDFASITALTNQLSTQASGLGNDAGNLLYADGIAAAQGLIKGLRSQRSAVDAEMLAIAKSMQAAIKKALGIHSPSQVFRDLGRQIPAGLGLGVKDGTPDAHRTITALATAQGYPGDRPGVAPAPPAAGAPTIIYVQAAMDPVATASAVSAELMWRNRR